MIRRITGGQSTSNAALLDEMYRARKRLFGDRLGWPVSSDAEGRETDRYDALQPLYLIATDEAGHHIGSLRLLRTTGDTMLKHHFSSILDGATFESPRIWECSRFCVGNDPVEGGNCTGGGAADMTALHIEHVTNCLLLGLCETALAEGLKQVVGMFDPQTLRRFHHSGWPPGTIAQSGGGTALLGVWDISPDSATSIRETSGIMGTVL